MHFFQIRFMWNFPHQPDAERFFPPTDVDLDYIFDPWMRSETLCNLLHNFDFSKEVELKNNDLSQSETYYIIHPVLKHIAVLKSKNL